MKQASVKAIVPTSYLWSQAPPEINKRGVEMNIPSMIFKQEVIRCGNTGELVERPEDLDEVTAGNIMAEVASSFLDEGQGLKAIIILNERQRLGI